MNTTPPLLLLFLFLIFIPAYADDSSVLKSPFDSFVDYVINSTIANIGGGNSVQDNRTTEIIGQTGEGVKKTFDFWLFLHEILVDVILWIAGWFNVSFDKTIALLISFVVGTILLGLGFVHFGKRFWKIALVIIIVILVISILPFENLKL